MKPCGGGGGGHANELNTSDGGASPEGHGLPNHCEFASAVTGHPTEEAQADHKLNTKNVNNGRLAAIIMN